MNAARRRQAYVEYLVIELDAMRRIVRDLEETKARLESTLVRHAVRETFHNMEGM